MSIQFTLLNVVEKRNILQIARKNETEAEETKSIFKYDATERNTTILNGNLKK